MAIPMNEDSRLKNPTTAQRPAVCPAAITATIDRGGTSKASIDAPTKTNSLQQRLSLPSRFNRYNVIGNIQFKIFSMAALPVDASVDFAMRHTIFNTFRSTHNCNGQIPVRFCS